MTQTNVTAPVLHKARLLAAFLLPFNGGDHLGIHGGLRCFTTGDQPSFFQRSLGDFFVVHGLFAAKFLQHFLGAFRKREPCGKRWRFGRSFGLWGTNTALNARRHLSISQRKNLRTDPLKARCVAILFDVHVQASANCGRRRFSFCFPESFGDHPLRQVFCVQGGTGFFQDLDCRWNHTHNASLPAHDKPMFILRLFSIAFKNTAITALCPVPKPANAA